MKKKETPLKIGERERKLVAELIADPASYRRQFREIQSEFWGRFGCTQSGGSRYENERTMPPSVAMLATLYALGYVSDDELAVVRGLLAPYYEEPAQMPDVFRPQLRSRAMSRGPRSRKQ